MILQQYHITSTYQPLNHRIYNTILGETWFIIKTAYLCYIYWSHVRAVSWYYMTQRLCDFSKCNKDKTVLIVNHVSPKTVFAAVVHVTFTLLLYQLVHANRGSHHWSKWSQHKSYGTSKFGTGAWAMAWASIQWLLINMH